MCILQKYTVGNKKCTVSDSIALFVLLNFVRELALVQDFKKPHLPKSPPTTAQLLRLVSRGPQIFQEPRSHLKIIGTRMLCEASCMLRTHSSGVTCECHYYSPFLLSTCEPIHIFVCKGIKLQ
jgi:hypothetical protein